MQSFSLYIAALKGQFYTPVVNSNGTDLALTVTATDYVIVEKNPSLYR
jgi:hypothetical protein